MIETQWPGRRLSSSFRVITCLACLLGCYLLNICRADDAVVANNVETSEKFQIVPGDPLFIPVSVFGEQYRFQLWLGVPCGVFHKKFRSELEALPLPEGVTIPSRTADAEFFPSPVMKIGSNGVPLERGSSFVLMTWPPQVPEWDWAGGGGMIGLDTIKSKVLLMNSDEGYFQLNNQATCAKDAHAEAIKISKNLASISIRLSDYGFKRFTLESSCGSEISVDRKLFDELLKSRHTFKPTQPQAFVADGSGINPIAREGIIDWIELGPYRFHNITIIERPRNAIGLAFLKRFNVELDFPNSVAYFLPSKFHKIPSRINRSGLAIGEVTSSQSDLKRRLIGVISPGCHAASLDIHVGDEITAINGIKTTTLTFDKLMDWLAEPGGKVTITIKRDAVIKTMDLELSNEPAPFPTTLARAKSTPHVAFDE